MKVLAFEGISGIDVFRNAWQLQLFCYLLRISIYLFFYEINCFVVAHILSSFFLRIKIEFDLFSEKIIKKISVEISFRPYWIVHHK